MDLTKARLLKHDLHFHSPREVSDYFREVSEYLQKVSAYIRAVGAYFGLESSFQNFKQVSRNLGVLWQPGVGNDINVYLIE